MDCSTPAFPVHHQLQVWACSNSCPSSCWWHPTIIFSVIPFSSCLQSFPASGSFPSSQFFTSGGQSVGVSISTSVPPMNIQDWFPLGWTGLISLQSKGLLRVFSILGRSKNYSCSSFGKTESRHTHFITGTVAKFTKVITQFLILEPVNMFWRALGQSVHFWLPQRLAMFSQVDVLLQKIPWTITPKLIWTTLEAFYIFLLKFILGWIVPWIMNTVWIWSRLTFS